MDASLPSGTTASEWFIPSEATFRASTSTLAFFWLLKLGFRALSVVSPPRKLTCLTMNNLAEKSPKGRE